MIKFRINSKDENLGIYWDPIQNQKYYLVIYGD